jgi:hypothetical protein
LTCARLSAAAPGVLDAHVRAQAFDRDRVDPVPVNVFGWFVPVFGAS